MSDSAERWSQELRNAQEELSQKTVVVTTGGGAVRVVMSGTQECREIAIDPSKLEDLDELAALVQLAVNQAIRDSQLMAARRLSPFSDQLDE